MYNRRNFGHIKSLLHFNFPYTDITTPGLKDEASPEIWTAHGNVTTSGRYQPVKRSTSPKFGWRCVYSPDSISWVSGTNNAGTFTLGGGLTSEFECFVKPDASSAGNIISFISGSTETLSISRTTAGTLNLSSPASFWNINLTGTTTLTAGAWHHVKVRASGSNITLILNANQELSGTINTNNLNVTECRIGGITGGYIDEFVFRDAQSLDDVPQDPYNGQISIERIGGFGTGRHGTLTVPANTTKTINAYGTIASSTNSKTFTVSSWIPGSLGLPQASDELMIYLLNRRYGAPQDLAGLYAFRLIASIDGNTFTLDRPITDEFNLVDALRDYTAYAVHVPHFQNVTIDKNGALLGQFRGLCVFRASGNVTVNGNIYAAPNSAPARTDSLTISHSDLPDRFLMSSGGGVMIFCGGTLSTSETGLIGHASTQDFNHLTGRGGKGGNSPSNEGQDGGIMAGGAAGNGALPSPLVHGPSIFVVAQNLTLTHRTMSNGGLNGTSGNNPTPGHYAGPMHISGRWLA